VLATAAAAEMYRARPAGVREGDPNSANVFDACVEDEKDASAKLAKDWAIFPAADKARCVHAAIYLPSYVEWLTCIEGESTLRRIRKDSTAPRV
jgi:hypothetical protein